MPVKMKKGCAHVSADRKFPSTSATQFPDNVSKPFWSFKDTTAAADDFFDCYVAFKDLGCHEYLWEWQGRKMDELVVKKLVTHYRDFFADNQIGKDYFLTFSTGDSDVGALGRLYMSVISSNDFTSSQKLFSPPLFELSHSSVSPGSMLHFARLYNESVVMASEKLKHDCGPKVLSLIPHHDFAHDCKWYASLNAYLGGFQNAFRCKLDYFRPFIPRARIADKLGFVGSVLATKRALASYAAFSKITGIDSHPIVETSPLLFRGGLTPFSLRGFVRTYPGARTATISPAFRYDYGVKDVKESVAALNSALPKNRAVVYSQDELKRLSALESVFAKHYSSAVSRLPDLRYLSDAAQRAKKSVPSELSRSFGLYSLGVPPEFIGAGKAIVECIKSGIIKDLESFYPDVKQDLVAAGVFLNKENLAFLAKTSPAWKSLLSEVNLVEDYVGQSLGPSSSESFMHRNHTSNIFHLASSGKDCSKDLLDAAKLRHCLG
jgi:phosphoenolpyruvate carboxylase